MSEVKLRLKLDDPHTREVWQAVLRARAEVAAWPAWKRGESSASTIQGSPEVTEVTHASSSASTPR